MSGKKAKHARKNEGHRSRKVVNPILNGELLHKLSRFSTEVQSQEPVCLVLVFLEDGEEFGLTSSSTELVDFVNDHVPSGLASYFTRCVGDSLTTEDTVYGTVLTVDHLIQGLQVAVEALVVTYEGCDFMGAMWEGCLARLNVDPSSDRFDIQYEVHNRAPFTLSETAGGFVRVVTEDLMKAVANVQ